MAFGTQLRHPFLQQGFLSPLGKMALPASPWGFPSLPRPSSALPTRVPWTCAGGVDISRAGHADGGRGWCPRRHCISEKDGKEHWTKKGEHSRFPIKGQAGSQLWALNSESCSLGLSIPVPQAEGGAIGRGPELLLCTDTALRALRGATPPHRMGRRPTLSLEMKAPSSAWYTVGGCESLPSGRAEVKSQD